MVAQTVRAIHDYIFELSNSIGQHVITWREGKCDHGKGKFEPFCCQSRIKSEDCFWKGDSDDWCFLTPSQECKSSDGEISFGNDPIGGATCDRPDRLYWYLLGTEKSETYQTGSNLCCKASAFDIVSPFF
jgi:hypothetical protein